MQEKQYSWAQGKKYAVILLTVLLPIVIAIISILVPILLEDEKQLSLEVVENKPLISVDQKIREEISISYNEEVMERLFLLTLKFVNDGNLGINGKTDIVERIEISLREDNCKIIGEPEILENPNDIKLTFYPTVDQKTVKFDFDLMNKGDYFFMDILYTGDELADPNVHAKIVDIKDIEIRSKTESSEKEQEENIMLILAGFSYVLLFLLIRVSEEYLLVWVSKKWKNIIKSACLFFVVMGSFVLYMGVWRIASQLKYENSLLGVSYPVFVTIILSIIVLVLFIKDTFFPRKWRLIHKSRKTE